MHKSSWKFLTVLITIGGLVAPQRAIGQASRGQAADSGRVALAKTFLLVSGAARGTPPAILSLLKQQSEAVTGGPSSAWDSLYVRVERALATLPDSLAIEYATRFSASELEELIRFYRSPVAQHWLKEQPALLDVSIEVGRRLTAKPLDLFRREIVP